MGRGGGHHGGGRSHHSSHRSHYRSHTRYRSGGGGRAGRTTSLASLMVFGTIFLLILIICAIVVPLSTADQEELEYCNDINSLSKQEQRVCTLDKTYTVKVTNGNSGTIAYRYKKTNKPQTIKRNRTFENFEEELRHNDFTYFSTEMYEGDYISLYYTSSRSVKFYFFDSNGLYFFKNRKIFTPLNKTTGTVFTHTMHATYHDVYYIGVDNTGSWTATVTENINITNTVYDVSTDTADDSCSDSTCTFKDVTTSEMIIVDYTGNKDSVAVTVQYGESKFNFAVLSAVFVCLFIIIIFLVIWGRAVYKVCKREKAGETGTTIAPAPATTTVTVVTPTPGVAYAGAGPESAPPPSYGSQVQMQQMPPAYNVDPSYPAPSQQMDSNVDPSYAPPSQQMGSNMDPSYAAPSQSSSYFEPSAPPAPSAPQMQSPYPEQKQPQDSFVSNTDAPVCKDQSGGMYPSDNV